MKIHKVDVEKRVGIEVTRQIRRVEDIMCFGEDNVYPEKMEALILGSPTAKACSKLLAKFLTGNGFSEELNSIVVGRDQRGKDIKLIRMLHNVASDIAKHQGFYLRCIYGLNENADFVINNVIQERFRKCRFGELDDVGYTAFVYVKDTWGENLRLNSSYLKNSSRRKIDKYLEKAAKYHVFNPSEEALKQQSKGGVKPQQIYWEFFSDEYDYPLSTFDSCYRDVDTENQVSTFRNNQVRNGFTRKTAVALPKGESKAEDEENVQSVKDSLGPEGDQLWIFTVEPDEEDQIDAKKAVNVTSIESSIDDKLYAEWSSDTRRNIRVAAENCPDILIDYESGKLGVTSGEAFTKAVEVFNAVTRNLRLMLGEALAEVLSLHENEALRTNTDWIIKPLTLEDMI